jgi:FixJ family two-component response regulator
VTSWARFPSNAFARFDVPLSRVGCDTAFWIEIWLLNSSNRKTVFVVDDDASTLRGVKRLLREYGFNAILFDSADALRNHNHFDEACCIVLDINLNNESGIDLRRQLAAAGILLPVIFITGNDSDSTRLAALESGCIAYLTKPFPAKSLIDPIQMASSRLA